MTEVSVDRREYLAALAGSGVVGLAGCSNEGATTEESVDGGDDGEDGGDDAGGDGGDGADGVGDDGTAGGGDDDTGTAESDGTTDTSAGTPPGTADDLALREANVTDVAVEQSGDGYRFDVTLYHDDDGEDGYANWWQVEDLDGERLGRRDLMHAHSTEPFTRSETVDVPDDVACVVVRGRDQTHEYGGQAMTVDVESGKTNPVRQGSERRSVAEGDCPG